MVEITYNVFNLNRYKLPSEEYIMEYFFFLRTGVRDKRLCWWGLRRRNLSCWSCSVVVCFVGAYFEGFCVDEDHVDETWHHIDMNAIGFVRNFTESLSLRKTKGVDPSDATLRKLCRAEGRGAADQ